MAKRKGGKKKKPSPAKRVVTMQALEELSSDDSEELPPESGWDEQAKALKDAIEQGKFDQVLQKADIEGGDPFEEADLDDDDEEEEVAEDDVDVEEEVSADDDEEEEAEDSDSTVQEENDDDDEPPVKKIKKAGTNQKTTEDEMEEEEAHQIDDEDKQIDLNEDAEDSDREEEEDEMPTVEQKNSFHAKALRVVAAELAGEKRKWPWAETFDVVVTEPLPFGTTEDSVNIHDDLKREVAFYDCALLAVQVAKQRCKQAQIPFTRPDDFFAEMVKTDEHMAKVKDRLIFENKKIEAVAQRKVNKEHKLRAKESHANKLAEKAKRRKDHFRAVDEWAQSAAANRGQRLTDNDDVSARFDNKPNKKRQFADRKYGFGGRRGRFKQNSPKEINDMADFNPRGYFGGLGTKKSAKKGGAGASRKGKRARDAQRSSR